MLTVSYRRKSDIVLEFNWEHAYPVQKDLMSMLDSRGLKFFSLISSININMNITIKERQVIFMRVAQKQILNI